MTTMREALAERYPLHYQRIVEAMHEQDTPAVVALQLSYPADKTPLHAAFVWGKTVEGIKYWSMLARAEAV